MSKVLVVTEWCPRYQEVADVSLPNMAEYCEIHGYDFHMILLRDDEGFHYKKHEFFKTVFEKDKYDLVFYRDIDAMITNLSIPIESFIDEQHDLFICSDDIYGINGGSLIIKTTRGGRWLNDIILSQRDNFNNEQEVMEWCIKHDTPFRVHAKILPHPSINSYPYKEYPELDKDTPREKGNWHEGDFLLHCPALTYEKRAEVLRNAKIIR